MLFWTAIAYVTWNRAIVAEGGEAWLHGEWLINYGAGFVRRGASGSFALFIADITGLSPLGVTEILQSAAAVLIIGAVGLALHKIGTPPLILIVTTSPAFIVFWLNNFGVPLKDIHGKDMLGYLTFLPMLYAASTSRSSQLPFVLSGTLYVFAVLFYEPNIFFAVPLILAAYIVQSTRSGLAASHVFAVFLLIAGGVLALLTVTFSGVPDIEAMCAELTQRGVNQSICGKFGWSTETLEHAMAFTSGRTGMRSVPRVGLAIAFALLPILVLFAKLRKDHTLFLAIVLQSATFLPLYFLGIDYGRWLHMQISSITLLILTALLAGKLSQLRAPSSRLVVWPLLALSFIWGLQPIYGGVEVGAVKYGVALTDALR